MARGRRFEHKVLPYYAKMEEGEEHN